MPAYSTEPRIDMTYIELRESGRFRVKVPVNGQRTSVGTFETYREAKAARDEFMRQITETQRLDQAVPREVRNYYGPPVLSEADAEAVEVMRQKLSQPTQADQRSGGMNFQQFQQQHTYADRRTALRLEDIQITPYTEGRREAPVTIPHANALILGDLHIPHHNVLTLQRAIYVVLTRYPDIRTIVFGGDTFDFSTISQHPQDAKELGAADTVRLAGYVLRDIISNFDEAYFINGNHDERVGKKLQNPWDLQLTVNAAFGDAWPEGKVTVSNLDYLYLRNDWMVIHPTKFSSIGGKTPSEMCDKYGRNIVSFHNHRAGYNVCQCGRHVGIDAGHCSVAEEHYYVHRRANTYPVWTNGFVVLRDGVPAMFNDLITKWSEYGC